MIEKNQGNRSEKKGRIPLSVIVPVCNTSPEYLVAALRSVTRSTLPSGCELLIIDDGSDVDYTEALTPFALGTEGGRFHFRYHRTKGEGTLGARLAGIRLCRGEAIVFLDSDDRVSVDYHRAMLERLTQGYDAVLGEWAFDNGRAKYVCTRDSVHRSTIELSGGLPLAYFFFGRGREHSRFVLWNKMLRTDTVRLGVEALTRALPKIPRLCYGEDALLSFFIFLFVRRLSSVHSGYYFYRLHNAQSVRVASEERLRSQIVAMGIVFSLVRRQIKARHLPYDSALRSWELLMCRTHVSYAREGGYSSLLPLIEKTYRSDRLRPAKASDSRVYVKNRLLFENFFEIDAALSSLFFTKRPTAYSSCRRDKYTQKTLLTFRRLGVRIYPSKKGVRIPKGRISLLVRLLHHPVLYALGNFLFPKGSRLRAYLKRFL